MNEKYTSPNLILASASPRRREILSSLGINYEVLVSDADENCELTDPGARVEHIASAKCRGAMDALGDIPSNTMILAADTLVVCEKVFLGKPRDAEDASRMLSMLSGRSHMVITAIAVYYDGRIVTAHETTEVEFCDMSDKDIENYILTEEPYGKAGAYAIQGHASRYIKGIKGDYFNVVGLPVHLMFQTVRDLFGIEL